MPHKIIKESYKFEQDEENLDMWLHVLIKAKKIGLCMKYGIIEVCNDWAWHFQRCLLKLGIGPGLLTSSCTF